MNQRVWKYLNSAKESLVFPQRPCWGGIAAVVPETEKLVWKYLNSARETLIPPPQGLKYGGNDLWERVA